MDVSEIEYICILYPDGSHTTLVFRPNQEQYKLLIPYIDKQVTVTVNGMGISDTNSGLRVVLPQDIPYFGNPVPHITTGVFNGGKAVDTWKIDFKDIEPYQLTGIITVIKL